MFNGPTNAAFATWDMLRDCQEISVSSFTAAGSNGVVPVAVKFIWRKVDLSEFTFGYFDPLWVGVGV